MDQERIEKQFSFIREIDREKLIGRQTYLTDGERKGERRGARLAHGRHDPPPLRSTPTRRIDVLKTVTMLLIHDIVEIDAGDTYAYDEEAKKTQKDRERKAAERIYGLLPCRPGGEAEGAVAGVRGLRHAGGQVCPLYGQPPAHDAQRRHRRKGLGGAPGGAVTDPGQEQKAPTPARRTLWEYARKELDRAQCGRADAYGNSHIATNSEHRTVVGGKGRWI